MPKRKRIEKTCWWVDIDSKKKSDKKCNLPDPLPMDCILKDKFGKRWRLGYNFARGAFGDVYLASKIMYSPLGNRATFAIKVEKVNNGNICEELFYAKYANYDQVEEWKKAKKLEFLGLPIYIGSGFHKYDINHLSFLVLKRYGKDLQTIIKENDDVFSIKTVFTLGIRILEVLEYIHSYGLVHCDIKAANLLLGYGDRGKTEVYVADFGLVERYINDGCHVKYEENPWQANNGTLPFISRDAHIGVYVRRGDFEILAYNMLFWLSGELPWKELEEAKAVYEEKIKHMKDITSFLRECFGYNKPPLGMHEFLDFVVKLGFEEDPDYELCKGIFVEAIERSGFKNDRKLELGENAIKKDVITRLPRSNNIDASPLNSQIAIDD